MLNTKTKMFLIPFFTVILSMVVIDAFWLGFMLKRFYTPQIGHLLSDSMQLTPAILFYVLFAAALTVFVVAPGVENNTDYTRLLLMGMFFGMVTYGTYDLTNQATLKNWP